MENVGSKGYTGKAFGEPIELKRTIGPEIDGYGKDPRTEATTHEGWIIPGL